MDLGNFAQVPVDESSNEPNALRITMEASASLEVVPSIYVGLFASLGVTTGDGDASVSVGGQAEVYGMVSMNLKAQSNFKFQTAIGVTEPLPPLEPGYCNSTLLGCAASCLNDSAQRSSAPPRTEYNMKQCNIQYIITI